MPTPGRQRPGARAQFPRHDNALQPVEEHSGVQRRIPSQLDSPHHGVALEHLIGVEGYVRCYLHGPPSA